MTFDQHDTDEELTHKAERLHDQLAETGDDIWVVPVIVDGEGQLVVVEGEGIGEYVMDHIVDLSVIDVEEAAVDSTVTDLECQYCSDDAVVVTIDGVPLCLKHAEHDQEDDNVNK